jgi:hypothetical protein
MKGSDSLEQTIRDENTVTSLPILTILAARIVLTSADIEKGALLASLKYCLT